MLYSIRVRVQSATQPDSANGDDVYARTYAARLVLAGVNLANC